MIFVVTTCMGRLHHLKQTAPRVLADARFEYVLSDYGCPDQSGSWMNRNHPRAHVVRTRAKVNASKFVFKKVEALNIGARKAIELGAEYLCFLDADTIVNPGFHDWVVENMSRDLFLICRCEFDEHPKTLETAGFLCVHRDHYLAVGGFDERMEGWGGDDMDLRAKLYMYQGLSWRNIPLDLIDPISHDDAARGKYYTVSKEHSGARNLDFVIENFKSWTGKYPAELIDTDVGRKFYELMGLDRKKSS